ncbi:MAG: CDP-alcohol phosphatidyltransferase family protein [Bacteroidota bacterium]
MRHDLPPAGELLNGPNLLSLLRMALLLPFAILLLPPGEPARLWAALVMALAALTDKLDGMLARRRGRTSEWGPILDPLADKVAAGGAALVMLQAGLLPLWFVLAVVGRDILLFGGGIWVRARTGVLVRPNETGRWTVGVLAAVMGAALLGAESPALGLVLGAATAMLVFSLLRYAVAARSLLSPHNG